MSSDEHREGVDSPVLKKRKMQRSCDICRRKKIRCEGGQMPDKMCNNCKTYNLECTYIEASKKRRHTKGYVEELEKRLEKMNELMHKFMPDVDVAQELEATELTTSSTPTKDAAMDATSPITSKEAAANRFTSVMSRVLPDKLTNDAEDESSAEEIIINNDITKSLQEMSIENNHVRFFGKSSSAALMHSALELKKHINEEDNPTASSSSSHVPFSARRPEFWNTFPWEAELDDDDAMNRPYEFPEPDLMEELIDLYFKRMNMFMPLLHRPIFDKSVSEGLHFQNRDFGATVLLVCAAGSRYSGDTRVNLDAGSNAHHSSGWKWFVQVRRLHVALWAQPTLYDLQKCALSVIYLSGCSSPHASWTTLGTGIRMAQDVGIHRKQASSATAHRSKAENELWRRAFWCLVCMDREMALALGRPCAIQDEDIDADLPIACDDEYWFHENPAEAFIQPADKPSVLLYFISYLELYQIYAYCMRTIYSINRSRSLVLISGQKWKKHIVSELDSTLNTWIDNIPDHLRWDPHREDVLFFTQSALLHTWYYHLQIILHRPFIPSPKKPNPTSYPSLAICTNAARVTSHILECHMKRAGALHSCAIPIFSAVIVLLLNIWSAKRSGMNFNVKKEMDEVHKCMKSLKTMEAYWHYAGRLWDILYELASAGELPLPLSPSNKRELDAESPKSSEGDSPAPMPAIAVFWPEMEYRPTINNSRTSAYHAREQSFEFTQPGASSSHVDPNAAFYGASTSSSPDGMWGAQLTPTPYNPSVTANAILDDGSGSSMFGGAVRYPQQPLDGVYGGEDEQVNPNQSHGYGPVFDSETMAMWPSGFELEDWGRYLTSVSDMTQARGV